MADYWRNRLSETQKKWTDKDIDVINKMLQSYYRTAMVNIIKEFEAVYDKVLAQAEEGKQITPADLYKLDKYYQMQAQLQDTLQKLGDKTCKVLSDKFGQEYKHIYSALAIDEEGKAIKASKSDKAFATIDAQGAKHIANQVWAADGKSWSERVWKNIGDLQRTLNEGLVDCVITGKKTTELKKKLMERFNVSYNRAETLVRTEMAHVETQAALDRYKSSGTEKIRIVVDPDERTCKECAKWDDKIIDIADAYTGTNCPPFHPRCRCAVAPVVEDKKEKVLKDMEEKKLKPIDINTINRAKLERMIERENITDNVVAFYRYSNDSGKLLYSTRPPWNSPDSWDYYHYNNPMLTYYYRDADMIAIKKTAEELGEGMTIKYWEKRYAEGRIDKAYLDKMREYDLRNKEQMLEQQRRRISIDWYASRYYNEHENEVDEWENMSWRERDAENTKFGQCIDCGHIFRKTNQRANAQKRCPECQAKYRKKYKAQKEKERRNKKKTK